jgi:hypothetical protein
MQQLIALHMYPGIVKQCPIILGRVTQQLTALNMYRGAVPGALCDREIRIISPEKDRWQEGHLIFHKQQVKFLSIFTFMNIFLTSILR